MPEPETATAEPDTKIAPDPLAEVPAVEVAAEVEKPAADATANDDKPDGEEKPADGEADGDKPDDKPEPTAFEKLVASTEDPEARVAMVQRVLDGLSDDERASVPALQAKLDATKGQQAQAQMRQAEATRQAGIRQAETDVSGATTRINAHLAEVLKNAKDADFEGDANYDLGLINGALEDYVKGEVVLRDQGQRQLFSSAVVTRLHELGEPLTSEKLQEMLTWAGTDEGKSRHQAVGAHLDELISRADARGFERGEAAGAEVLERFKKSELRAYISEQMREQGMEPDAGPAKPVIGGSDEDRVDRLAYGKDSKGRTATDEDREWLAAHN